jgi:hypothetical protein
MMLPGAKNQATFLLVLLCSINKQTNPLLQNHFHSDCSHDHYVFQKTLKLIEDYISNASRIMSLLSNQLLAFTETQILPAPSSHSTCPASNAGDLLLNLVAHTNLQQVLQEQLLSLLAAPTHKQSCNRHAHLPKPN